ncbi:unnamed protein product [Blepharisma stoltei]|uniref:Uncharacterized protein n=1 Tax=Blepharisma stoltei TaxID=1481888 RepID=A0AAU9JLH9_9CILI|nr:unnamed protein product [Blepharisma stoltei]
MGSCNSKQRYSISFSRSSSRKLTQNTLVYERQNTKHTSIVPLSNPAKPNRRLLLDYYANESSKMPNKIKKYYEAIFAEEELEVLEIDLEHVSFDLKSIYNFKLILNFFQNLRVLNLGYTDMTSADLKRVYKSIDNLVLLETLSLKNNKIDPSGGDYLSKIIKHLFNLKNLYLHNNQLGSDGLLKFCEGLQNLNKLEKLTLDNNNLEDNTVLRLLEALTNMKNLTCLGLSENDITSKIGKALIETIDNLPKLAILRLHNTQLHPKYLMIIENKLKYTVNY